MSVFNSESVVDSKFAFKRSGNFSSGKHILNLVRKVEVPDVLVIGNLVSIKDIGEFGTHVNEEAIPFENQIIPVMVDSVASDLIISVSVEIISNTQIQITIPVTGDYTILIH